MEAKLIYPILPRKPGVYKPSSSRFLVLSACGLLGWALPCLVTLIACWSCPPALGATIHPYYQRRLPTPQIEGDFASDTFHIDLANAHIPEYGGSNTVA